MTNTSICDRATFFHRLYQYCEGAVELRALPSRKRAFIDFDWGFNPDPFCQESAKDNLYFGVATRDGKGGGKDNIIHIPALWADIDYKETPRELIAERLKQFPFNPSIIVRSGGGIHIYWCLKEPADPSEIPQVEDANRRIAHALGGDLNACDAARILRVPDTINHKYPAKCEVAQLNDFHYEVEDFLNILPEPPVSTESKSSQGDGEQNQWLIKAMKGVGEGKRNATGTKIAGYWINKVSANDVLTILHTWNQGNKPPLPEKDLETIAKSVSRYEPDKAQKRVDISHVYDAKRMLEEYRAYIKTLRKNRFVMGVREIDRRIRGIAGGEVLTIIARAGSFKTAMLQNLLKNYVQNSSWGAAFFSIEMAVPTLVERYHEILGGMPGRDIEALYLAKEEGAEGLREKLEADFVKDLSRLYVVPVKVSISDIASYVGLIEQTFNIKIGVIGVDYLGLIDGPGANEYETISRLARDIKTTAKMLNLPVILLSQVSRKGGGGEVEISLDMGRGSGAIEEGADFILGLWQVERQKLSVEDSEPDYDLICRILKNRKGAKGSRWKLDLDPTNLRIGPDAEPWERPKKKRKDVLADGDTI